MATTQGKASVLLLAVAPPVVVVLRCVLHPRYLIESSKTLLLVYCILYVFAVRFITVPYLTSPLLGLPRPPGGSFLQGQLPAARRKPRGAAFREWIDTVPNAGLIYFRGFSHSSTFLLLTSPEALQDVLITNAYDFEKKTPDRMLLIRTIGRGLVTVEGAEHKAQRRSVTPAFSGKHIKELVPLFWSKAQEFAQVLANQLDVSAGADEKGRGRRTGVFDIDQWASRVTLDIIGQACVGRDFNSIYNSDDEFVQLYEKINKPHRGNDLIFILLTTVLPLYIARWTPFLNSFREASEAKYQLRPLCRRLIEVKRQDMETESEKHIDILSVLIRSRQFSDDGLVDQLLTFLAAGHDTTAGALTFTIWLLAINPSIQEKLRAELRTYFAHNHDHDNTTTTTSSLDALPYLNAVTNEQLRLFPIVPITNRQVVRDTAIVGQHVPKGTTVVMSPWAINCSKALWGPDAQEYRPERWLPDGQGELGGGKSALSLLTFLHGPRSCIGQAFSRAELKCLVAALVTRFEIQMADPSEVIELVGYVTIKPKNGIRLRLKEL